MKDHTYEEAQTFLAHAENNLRGLARAMDEEAFLVVLDERGRIVTGAQVNSEGLLDFPGHEEDGQEVPENWDVEHRYDLKAKYIKNTSEFLYDNMRYFHDYVVRHPDCDLTASSIATPQYLMDIAGALKKDNRFVRMPKIFDALTETAIACGYGELVEIFSLESIWSQILQINHEKLHPIQGSNAPVRAHPEKLLAQLQAVNTKGLSDTYQDLHDVAQMQIEKMLGPSGSQSRLPSHDSRHDQTR